MPAATHFARSSGPIFAVNAKTGVAAAAPPKLRNARVASRPFMPGMKISIKTMSYEVWRRAAMAVCPLPATSTLCPSRRSSVATIVLLGIVSSTSSTRVRGENWRTSRAACDRSVDPGVANRRAMAAPAPFNGAARLGSVIQNSLQSPWASR